MFYEVCQLLGGVYKWQNAQSAEKELLLELKSATLTEEQTEHGKLT